MRRRTFLLGVSGFGIALPTATHAQQASRPIVGVLDGVGSDAVGPFMQGLADKGFVEGRGVSVIIRSTNKYELLPSYVQELLSKGANVIAAIGGPPAYAAKAATQSVPVVFGIGGDPVELGLVASLNRPGGNLTGATFLATELLQKQVGLLHQLAPAGSSIGVLVNAKNPRIEVDVDNITAAARLVGRQSLVARVTGKADIDGALTDLRTRGAAALLIPGDAAITQIRAHVAEVALRHRLPAMYIRSEFARAGGLITYGPSYAETYRQVGHYAGRILKGEKPADLPVQQPTRFELVINLKTAKALGLDFPATLLAIADEVIE